MRMRPLIVGIDPGLKTGIAIINSETDEILEVSTSDFCSVFFRLQNLPARSRRDYLLVIENAKLNKQTYHRHRRAGRQNQGVTDRIGRGIGSVQRESELLVLLLQGVGYEVVQVKPDYGAKKWSRAELEQITGYTDHTSEHGRDAVRLAMDYIDKQKQRSRPPAPRKGSKNVSKTANSGASKAKAGVIRRIVWR